jgi:hypothetical protein
MVYNQPYFSDFNSIGEMVLNRVILKKNKKDRSLSSVILVLGLRI